MTGGSRKFGSRSSKCHWNNWLGHLLLDSVLNLGVSTLTDQGLLEHNFLLIEVIVALFLVLQLVIKFSNLTLSLFKLLLECSVVFAFLLESLLEHFGLLSLNVQGLAWIG